MNATGNPKAPGFDGQRMIQVQRKNSRSSTRSQPNDLSTVFIPSKMFAPIVLPRMKESGSSTGFRVAGKLLLTFELIAEGTAQAEILKFGYATC